VIDVVSKKLSHIPIDFLCRHFGASRSGYYNWRKRSDLPSRVKKKKVCTAIAKAFKDSGKTYGSPRMWREVKELGCEVSENTVAKYMKELGLDARHKKKYRVMTTDSNHSSPIAERLFKVEDHHTLPTAPGQVLAGDITYLRLGGSFLYLAVVIDIFTREVVGWSIQRSLQTKLVLDALADAIKRTSPDAEVIFHSDRGSQYASEAYRSFCGKRGVLPSMSRRGNCYDNSYVESWFSSLKKDRIYRRQYKSEQELRADVFDYIERWYNRRRRHSALGYLSPLQYKEAYAVAS